MGVETALWKRAVIPSTTNQMMFSSLSDIWVGKWGCCSSFFKLNYFNCMLTAKLYCTYVYIQYFSWFIKASNLDFLHDFICMYMINFYIKVDIFSVALGPFTIKIQKK